MINPFEQFQIKTEQLNKVIGGTRPEGAGKPDWAGKPELAGKPEGAGKPSWVIDLLPGEEDEA